MYVPELFEYARMFIYRKARTTPEHNIGFGRADIPFDTRRRWSCVVAGVARTAVPEIGVCTEYQF